MRKRLQRPTRESPGRIILRRPPNKLQKLFINLLIVVLIFFTFCLYISVKYHIPYITIIKLSSILLLFVSPSILAAIIESFAEAWTDPDRRLYREERIKIREEKRRKQQALDAAIHAPDALELRHKRKHVYIREIPPTIIYLPERITNDHDFHV